LSKFHEFKDKQIVAIRFGVPEDLSLIPNNLEAFEQVYETHRIKEKSRSASEGWVSKVATQAGQLREFVYEMNKENAKDRIITYGGNRNGRIYLRGWITTCYRYDQEVLGPEYPHVRDVEWKGSLNRDVLSEAAKRKLGRPLTVFKVDQDTEDELLNKGS
jgi:restriction system protein